MYTVEPDFNKLLKDNVGLLTLLANKVYKKTRFHNATYDDVFSMVQTAAWKAWLAQNKQAQANNGLSPYKWNTYLTWHIRLIMRDYPEIQYDYHHQSLDIDALKQVPKEDFSQQVFELLENLDETQRKVIGMRFFDNMTLQECSGVMNKSIENVRQIQNNALIQMKRYATKS